MHCDLRWWHHLPHQCLVGVGESSSFFMKRASEHTKDTLCRTRVIADAQPLATRMRLESATLSQLLKGREAF